MANDTFNDKALTKIVGALFILNDFKMKLQHFNPELKIHEDSYLWRYMSIDKTKNFFSDNEIYFSRLDKFEDPLEGLPFILRGNLQVKNVIRCEENENNFIEYCERTKWLSGEEIRRYQNGVFVSCWYLTENISPNSISNHHESLAMWNWQNSNSFLIKISYKQLVSLVSESLTDFQSEGVFAAYYGKIHYLNYGEYANLINNPGKLNMPSLIKHNCYKYENELRFILLKKGVVRDDTDKTGIKLRIKKKFNQVVPIIEVFTHPDIDEQKFKEYKDQFSGWGFEIKVSSIVSKKVMKLLINGSKE